VRRLSPTQYYRTLQAAFQDPNVPEESILSNPAVLGFHVDAKAAVIRDLDAELLMNYSETVADWAVETKLNQVAPCTTNDSACRRRFIGEFGAKLHREPLSEDQITAYEGLFPEGETFADGVRTVLSAMLQSPLTIYRRELGAAAGNQYALTPYELASELSYFLTDGPPDTQLRDAAANNRLNTPEDIAREAERLIYTPEAKETLSHFVEGWLEIDRLHTKAKNETLKPLPAELRVSLVQETRELFQRLFFEGGKLSDLFTADYTYADQQVASFYGLSGPGGANFERLDLSGSNRPKGILGHGGWLTTHALADNSSPVQRAKVVIERLLCESLIPPPQGLDTTLKVASSFKTNRERYEQHSNNDQCRGCHLDMDPIGFAFENYDAFGQWRSQENGNDIDASGAIAQLAGGPYPLDGVDSLSTLLAESPQVQACLVRYWSYFAHGTDTWRDASCSRNDVVQAALAQDFSLKSVLMALVTAPHFAERVKDE
jgi:Protein of unknown function (DUF1592)/Protein of unknown function (DUF1588)/Protein of unknown function (DUF1595)/Protein of unknown function (DUF1585)/Protein of unknown function (DUF1587)